MTSMVMPWLQHAAAIPVKNNFIYFSSTKKNSKIKKENFAEIVDSAEMAQQDNEEVMGDDMDNNDDDVVDEDPTAGHSDISGKKSPESNNNNK